jgi:hypothetical protein
MINHINNTQAEAAMRAIHAMACAAVMKNDRTLTPDVDAFWPIYLQAAITAAHALPFLTDAARDVLTERGRQADVEGWTAAHDDDHDCGDLALAGAAYALHAGCNLNPFSQQDLGEQPIFWPWSAEWWKPGDTRRSLVKAAALIIAEIERIDRAIGKHGKAAARCDTAQSIRSKVTLAGPKGSMK